MTVAGQAWRLWLDRPADAPSDADLPLIWVLDGAELFAVVSSTVRRLSRRPDATGVPPCIVVGVDRDPADRTARWFDATAQASSDPDHAATPHGGAQALLDLVTGPFLKAVEETGAMDRARQTLVGHSLMALLTLYAAATRPGAFHTFAAVSPSIWWNPDMMTARLTAMPDAGQRVFLAVGEREDPAVVATKEDRRRVTRRMVGHAREAAAVLTARLGPDRAGFHIAPDEDHASVLPAILPRLLRFAFETDHDR